MCRASVVLAFHLETDISCTSLQSTHTHKDRTSTEYIMGCTSSKIDDIVLSPSRFDHVECSVEFLRKRGSYVPRRPFPPELLSKQQRVVMVQKEPLLVQAKQGNRGRPLAVENDSSKDLPQRHSFIHACQLQHRRI